MRLKYATVHFMEEAYFKNTEIRNKYIFLNLNICYGQSNKSGKVIHFREFITKTGYYY